MAKLKQLCVRIFQQLDGRHGAFGRIVDERRDPADDEKIVRIVRDAGL